MIFIYLVMAAQFESFVDPFIIMLTVPLSLAGALITLKFVQGSINIYSQIGLITLIGLITKHGILIVEFANQIFDGDKKISLNEAVMKASLLRLRPILMTTAAMVLVVVPLVFTSGAGAESSRQIGWVIFGGMTIGTIFTLFVVPAVYTFLSARRTQRKT
ncbi:MAG: efflux RND transporter permease subunit [Holosporaceae bacterium]|nr:MAG: efflux RND transporter permease subunit [Holosporaceae bacterium]